MAEKWTADSDDGIESQAGFVKRILDDHGRMLRGLAYSLAKQDQSLADDLVQETLLKAWRSRRGFETRTGDAKKDAGAWLMSILRNTNTDRIRSNKGQIIVDTNDARNAALAVEDDNNPEEAAMSSQWTQRMQDAVKKLPERQRLALMLFHYEGLSQLEVAEKMGISDEAVESLLARARRQLKITLKDSQWVKEFLGREGE